MTPKKEITLLITGITLATDLIIELFHARAHRAESYSANHLNNQPGFLSNNIPLLTAEGIQQLGTVGNVFGMNYWLNDRMYFTDNAGAQEASIQTGNTYVYSYRTLLNYLSAQKIKIGKVKIQGSAMADIRNNWTIRRYYIDGQKDQKEIDLQNAILPEQVNSNVLEFDLNEVIDGNTAIEVKVKAGTAYSIVLFFDEV